MFWPLHRFVHVTCLLLAGLLLAGCADTAYYWQSVSGHVKLMQAARPIEQWLASPQTPAHLRDRLLLAQSIRRYAVTDLHLPDNASYQRFAELPGRYVVWNVVAAPELSLTLKTWCFPVAGCVGYRGYFDQAEARALADGLRAQGLEVSVYGVPAYSTLGWLNWAGGDPLLSSLIHDPDGELARLMFHELAHQVLYVADDTAFNESFATAVERLGLAQWLAAQATPAAQASHWQQAQRRRAFAALTRATRRQLALVYMEKTPVALDRPVLLAMKNEVMRDFRAAYAELKKQWGGYSGFDAWVAQANNAAFGAQAAYDDLVPGFEALFARQGRDWRRFYAAVRQLAKLPAPKRAGQLHQWAKEQQLG
jgi:predicted aminopeptidase